MCASLNIQFRNVNDEKSLFVSKMGTRRRNINGEGCFLVNSIFTTKPSAHVVQKLSSEISAFAKFRGPLLYDCSIQWLAE